MRGSFDLIKREAYDSQNQHPNISAAFWNISSCFLYEHHLNQQYYLNYGLWNIKK